MKNPNNSVVIDRPGHEITLFPGLSIEMDIDLSNCPIKGLSDFPENLWVLYESKSNVYACFCFANREGEPIHGLAVFTTKDRAVIFNEYMKVSMMKAELITFDEARDIAKAKKLQCLLLLDNIENPEIHYIV